MMRGVLLGLLFLPGLVEAAAYEVRSGEHAEFSRLVIYLDRPRDWQVQATPGGYELTIDGGTDGFDIQEVFNFIPKRRLTALQSTPGRLGLDVSCDCPVQAFPFRDDILVIDIHSGVPDPDGFPDARVIAPFREETRQSENKTAAPENRPPAEYTAPSQLPHWTMRPAQASHARKVLAFSPAPPVVSRVDAAGLVAGLADAASHGLVTLADPEITATGGVPILPGLRQAGQQVRVQDALFRGEMPDPMLSKPDRCLPGELFDVENWGDPDRPAAQVLADLRAQGAETSQSGMDAAVTLYRTYLYLGFGSEASEIVRTYRIPEPDARIYRTLARIVDFPGQADANPLADQRACDHGGALWALAATREGNAHGPDINTKAVLRTYPRLPVWLRLQLADVLSSNFEIRGDETSAEAIRSAASRARVSERLQNGVIADTESVAQGDTPGLENTVRSDRSTRIGEFLMTLNSLDEGGTTTPETRAEIAALIREARGSEESVQLLEAYSSTATEVEDILTVESLMLVLSRSRFANRYPLRESRDRLLSAATAHSSHDLFLGILSRNRRAFEKVPPNRATSDAAITRLISMGLPESAAYYRGVLNATPQDPAELIPSVAEGTVTQSLALVPASSAEGVEGDARQEALASENAGSNDLRVLLAPIDPEIENRSETPLEALRRAASAIEALGPLLRDDRAVDG